MSPDWIISQREQELMQSAADDLPVFVLADDVSKLLVHVLEQITVDASQQDRNPHDLRRHALWFMTIITLRAMRSAMLVLAIGYEEQSVGFQRLIDELHNRAQQICADESGDVARRWLDGKSAGKGAKLAGQEFWELLSGPVTQTSRPTRSLCASPAAIPTASTETETGPVAIAERSSRTGSSGGFIGDDHPSWHRG